MKTHIFLDGIVHRAHVHHVHLSIAVTMKFILLILSLSAVTQAGKLHKSSLASFEESVYSAFVKVLGNPDQYSAKSDASQHKASPAGSSFTRVTGARIVGEANDHAHSFFSIPYAEAPIGDLR